MAPPEIEGALPKRTGIKLDPAPPRMDLDDPDPRSRQLIDLPRHDLELRPLNVELDDRGPGMIERRRRGRLIPPRLMMWPQLAGEKRTAPSVLLTTQLSIRPRSPLMARLTSITARFEDTGSTATTSPSARGFGEDRRIKAVIRASVDDPLPLERYVGNQPLELASILVAERIVPARCLSGGVEEPDRATVDFERTDIGLEIEPDHSPRSEFLGLVCTIAIAAHACRLPRSAETREGQVYPSPIGLDRLGVPATPSHAFGRPSGLAAAA